MKAPLIAPSARSRRIRPGKRKATTKASAAGPAPSVATPTPAAFLANDIVSALSASPFAPMGAVAIVRAACPSRSRSMPENRFDVLTIGNAIVDVFAHTDDDFLVAEGLTKGAMALTSEVRAEALYAKMAQAVEISGGSAANTV